MAPLYNRARYDQRVEIETPRPVLVLRGFYAEDIDGDRR